MDANQAWSVQTLYELSSALVDLRVDLLEQPVPANADEGLVAGRCPIPVCADEAFNTLADLPRVRERYDFVNIKLDKCGGLSEALKLAREARARGFGLMVGSMCGTSLAMAPAFLVAQQCDYVDLDGPLWLSADREAAMHYDRNSVAVPPQSVWG